MLSGDPLVQDVAFAATAGLIGAKFFVVFVERRGEALAEIHRRRIDAAWIVVTAVIGSMLYMLLR